MRICRSSIDDQEKISEDIIKDDTELITFQDTNTDTN